MTTTTELEAEAERYVWSAVFCSACAEGDDPVEAAVFADAYVESPRGQLRVACTALRLAVKATGPWRLVDRLATRLTRLLEHSR